MLMDILLLIVGFVILIKGADIFVDGASSVAGNFKVPKILIGLTIVAFGTSAPELAVSIKSLLSGNGDIVIGNVMGSNIINITLILGASALFHALRVKSTTVKKEIPITLLLTVLFAVLLTDSLFDAGVSNAFTRSDGLVILLFFSVFVYHLVGLARHQTTNKQEDEQYHSLPKALFFTLLGLLAIIFGSNFVVDSAVSLAIAFGVSEKLIALTIIALGTSLPELVTSITATRKGEYEIAIGNVVGSNIFNMGIVLGLPVALFGGITSINFDYIDICVMLLSVILLTIFAANDRQISKKEGLVFLTVFTVYYSYILLTGISF